MFSSSTQRRFWKFVTSKYISHLRDTLYSTLYTLTPSNCNALFQMRSLTHWGRATHTCVGKLTIIGSDNGLSPGRHQAIIWTNAGILLIGPLGTNFSEILIEIQTFSLTKIRLKISSAKCCSFRLGLNVFTDTLLNWQWTWIYHRMETLSALMTHNVFHDVRNTIYKELISEVLWKKYLLCEVLFLSSNPVTVVRTSCWDVGAELRPVIAFEMKVAWV